MEADYYIEFRKERLTALKKHFDILAEKKNIRSTVMLRNTFLVVANCFLMEQNDALAKEYYYKAGRGDLLYVRLYMNRYPQYTWDTEEAPSFVATVFYGIIPMLLSDNRELLGQFARQVERLPYERYKNKADIAICYAVKYVLLHEKEKARTYLGEWHLKAKSLTKGLGYVLAGILQDNLALINEGIRFQIKIHRINNKESLFYRISEEATAWVKLAQLFGYRPDTSSPFLHQGLLSPTSGVVYNDIHEVYEALEITPLD